MLPGFRLFAITVAAAASLLVFGLGAAAVLRATHQEFAAVPLRNLQTPPSSFVAEIPTLAVLQVEPHRSEKQEPAPTLAPIPAPPAKADAIQPDESAGLPLVIIPDPPPFPLTDATTVANLEAQPQLATKPAAASASAIKIRSVARKRAAMRAKARPRFAHRYLRRRSAPPAPPQPAQRSFFSLFDPAPAPTTAATPTIASSAPPRR